MIEIELPYPPSVNHYWRHVPLRNKHGVSSKISKAGRKYREDVMRIVAESGLEMIRGPIAIKRILYCPDLKERDADNTAKAIYDSLAHAELIEGDQFVCAEISEKRIDADKIGRVILQISPVKEAVETISGAWLK